MSLIRSSILPEASTKWNSVTITDYGPFGQKTIDIMTKALKDFDPNLYPLYCPVGREFTILNSHGISKESIEKVLEEHEYSDFRPQVQYPDPRGDWVIRLEGIFDWNKNVKAKRLINNSDSLMNNFDLLMNKIDSLINKLDLSRVQPLYLTSSECPSLPMPSSDNLRRDIAADLVSKMKEFGITFQGRQCLDIGTGSGENALAMQQESGREVIAIEPDDSVFNIALKNGISPKNLHKVTLQEYQKAHPDDKFDIATVFLWNLPFSERESFCRALTEVIKEEGTVVIGYADECYDKDPRLKISGVLRKYFSSVERHKCPQSINHYMLICKAPIDKEEVLTNYNDPDWWWLEFDAGGDQMELLSAPLLQNSRPLTSVYFQEINEAHEDLDNDIYN